MSQSLECGSKDDSGNSLTAHSAQCLTCDLSHFSGSLGICNRSCSRLKAEHATHLVTVSCVCDAPAAGVEVVPVADEVVAARVGENADDLGGGGGDARLVSAHCMKSNQNYGN